jgi:hypothetical protein
MLAVTVMVLESLDMLYKLVFLYVHIHNACIHARAYVVEIKFIVDRENVN